MAVVLKVFMVYLVPVLEPHGVKQIKRCIYKQDIRIRDASMSLFQAFSLGFYSS